MIFYKKLRHYKYVLHADIIYPTPIIANSVKDDGLVQIDKRGTLTIKKGYAWDGPSGPTIDTKNFMRGSLIHDALYQLIREGFIPQDERQLCDDILRRLCRQDGMSYIRALWVYQGVRLGGASSTQPDMLIAP
jgi:hypothetical protein